MSRDKPTFIKRLPAAPLLACFPDGTPNGVIADQIGVERCTVNQMKKPNAKVRWYDADRYAIRIGKHPAQIWGVLWTCEVDPVKKRKPANTR